MFRTRFAPSPTGEPHIGNIRTALFEYLAARHQDGKFVLRIEDTDKSREVPGSKEKIMLGLSWLGLAWDEGPEVGGPYGPYVSSERLDLYQKLAKELVEKDWAYYCFCSPQRLEEVKKAQVAKGEIPRYDRHCRALSREECQIRLDKEEKAVIRLKVPETGEISFDDIVRGKVTFQNKDIDDQVLLKSDGYPTYHLAVVIDDYYMKINYIIRAEEWLPSTPKHLLLYQAFNWEIPYYAHLPMVLGPDRAKLSKRHGATSLLEYRDKGYLPEAMINFLALLGWSPKDGRDLLTKEELIREFSLDRIQKNPAVFDKDKLDWFNGQYIRKLEPQELSERLKPFIPADYDKELVKKVVPLIQDRLVTLKDFAALTDFFFVEKLEYDKKLLIQKGKTVEEAKEGLEKAVELVEKSAWEHDALESAFRSLAEELGWKTGELFMALRVALTGRTATPPLFETMIVLGREKVVKRLKEAVGKLAE
jgi:glutamyl-tRNA synthetase